MFSPMTCVLFLSCIVGLTLLRCSTVKMSYEQKQVNLKMSSTVTTELLGCIHESSRNWKIVLLADQKIFVLCNNGVVMDPVEHFICAI